jgi:hypothetical protein
MTRLFHAKTKKLVFLSVFGHFGAIRAPPNGPKKVYKGPQVGRMYDPMCEPKNKPLTKSLDPFF